MIQLINISKSFQYEEIFHQINFTFLDGHAYGLVGRNGSGKSVLLNLMTGFIKPDSGQVLIDGQILGRDVDFIQDAGVSINQPEFMPGWTGYDSLMYLANIRKKINQKEVSWWVEKMGLTKAIHKPYKTYSQGMKQKMRIIQALMEHPKYLIMDEPFNALDEQSVELVQTIFNHFKSPQTTIIFTSHDQTDISSIADTILPIETLKKGSSCLDCDEKHKS